MEAVRTVPKDHQDEYLDFPSQTYCVVVGCGKLYVTIVSKDGQVVRVIAHRKSNFFCDLTWFDSLNRQTSFQTNRDLEQAIIDLKGNDSPRDGHFCHKYSIKVKSAFKKGHLAGYSCPDAIARCLERVIYDL